MTRAAASGRALGCMIVGGHKCGTTSLKEYLGAHPEVATHPQLEFTAFSQKDYSPGREREELGTLLDDAGERLALAKHAGLYAEPFSLDRLREAAPDCRILLILRDPVARARSAFRMEAVTGAASATRSRRSPGGRSSRGRGATRLARARLPADGLLRALARRGPRPLPARERAGPVQGGVRGRPCLPI